MKYRPPFQLSGDATGKLQENGPTLTIGRIKFWNNESLGICSEFESGILTFSRRKCNRIVQRII
jgi:hypothetical protein